MSIWQTHPADVDRFDDLALVINRNRRTNHCWCLSHRLKPAQIDDLGRGNREEAMRALTRGPVKPGVITYRDGEPVGWCSISPRSEIPRLMSSRLIRPVDDVAVWSIICVVVRPGYRRNGVTGHMLEGALDYARGQGAPAVEAYPVVPEGRMDTTMAFVGTYAMFAKAGFTKIGTTDAVAGGMPRIIMRRDLT